MVVVQWRERSSEYDLSGVARLLSDFWREVIPDEPDLSTAELAAEVARAPGHRRMPLATATDAGELVGAARLVLDDRRGHETRGWVKYLVVRGDRRRHGVGSALVEAVSRRAAEEGRTRLESFVALTQLGGMSFASASGATTGLVDCQNRLHLKDLDWRLLEEWVSKAAERAQDYELVCFDGICPDRWLAQFTELISVMNTAPRSDGSADVFMTEQQVRASEEAHLRGGGWGWTVCACYRPSGRLVGYTELGGSSHRPWLAIQGDTGVEPTHRNRGLGRWIKATNALRLLQDRPDTQVIETWNADVNAPMLSINNAMGFQPVANWQGWNLEIRAR